MAARWRSVFGDTKPVVIGMIHVQALPGAPNSRLSVSEIVHKAVQEAVLYRDYGLEAIMIENTHDRPYTRAPSDPHVTALMTRVATEVRQVATTMPLGVQVLAGCNREALGVALASGASFIRAEGYVYSHVADEGWMDACAGNLLRYRQAIGAEDILVLTDIKKKHCSHSVTMDQSPADVALAAQFFCSDGVIVTGPSTGSPADSADVDSIRAATSLPVLIGSGVTADNLEQWQNTVDALIVGSELKQGGMWYNDIDVGRVERFLARKHELSTTVML